MEGSDDAVRETIADAQAMGAKILKLRLPFVAELKNYTLAKCRHDLFAAATLTLVSIPQAIGFALIMDLPSQVVIVSVIIGGFVGALFFSSHHHVFGPTSSISIITAATIAAHAGPMGISPLHLAVLLAFLIGVIQVAAGLVNFGELTKFISRSVIVAYSAGIGLILIASQLHNFLGFTVESAGSFGMNIWEAIFRLFDGLVSIEAIVAGLMTLGIFWLVRRLRPGWPESLIGLAIMGALARIMVHFDAEIRSVFPHLQHLTLVRDQGAVRAILPAFAGLHWNGMEFDTMKEVFTTAVAISILGMLEAAAITKGLAARSGQKIEPNQELVGMGAANIACSLFGAVPGSSSFARSAVNFQSGAASQLSSMFSSMLVLIVLLFVTPIFNYIPVAALAAHLIRVGSRMLNWHQIRICCRSTRSDVAVFSITMIAALFLKLDTAIYMGIGVAVALFLQKTSTPLLEEYTFNEGGALTARRDNAARAHPYISIIHVEGDLYFGAADVFVEQIRNQAEDRSIEVFILRMKNARHLDASTAMALESLHDYLRSTGRHLLISGVTEDIQRVLRNSGLLAIIGEENVFPAEANPTISTKRALDRATELLHAKEADVRLFYDRPQPKPAS
ncbi:MAG TPA: SulP family inorganic anion transporter [Candidatus Didemnitutus sp.]|nr:SulP family inorganic anion transporter [Candidatus Didemnitutus sp.]